MAVWHVSNINDNSIDNILFQGFAVYFTELLEVAFHQPSGGPPYLVNPKGVFYLLTLLRG